MLCFRVQESIDNGVGGEGGGSEGGSEGEWFMNTGGSAFD